MEHARGAGNFQSAGLIGVVAALGLFYPGEQDFTSDTPTSGR